MSGLLHAHSGLRWIALIIIIYTIVNALRKVKKGTYTDNDKILSVLSLAMVHLQVVIGLILYFMENRHVGIDMKDPLSRLYSMEHPLMMIIGAVLITIGHSKSKKATKDSKKFKVTYTFYIIGLLVILSRIPWPFLSPSAGWF